MKIKFDVKGSPMTKVPSSKTKDPVSLIGRVKCRNAFKTIRKLHNFDWLCSLVNDLKSKHKNHILLVFNMGLFNRVFWKLSLVFSQTMIIKSLIWRTKLLENFTVPTLEDFTRPIYIRIFFTAKWQKKQRNWCQSEQGSGARILQCQAFILT